jgi:hypothetical protein
MNYPEFNHMQTIYENRKPNNRTVVKLPQPADRQYWIEREFTLALRRGKAMHQRNPVLEANTRDYFQRLTNWRPDQW